MNISVELSKDANHELSTWLTNVGVGIQSSALGDTLGQRRKISGPTICGSVYRFEDQGLAFIRTPSCWIKVTGSFSSVDRAATKAVRHSCKKAAAAYLWAAQYESGEVA